VAFSCVSVSKILAIIGNCEYSHVKGNTFLRDVNIITFVFPADVKN